MAPRFASNRIGMKRLLLPIIRFEGGQESDDSRGKFAGWGAPDFRLRRRANMGATATGGKVNFEISSFSRDLD